jgi:hypothetical protein
MFSRPNNYIIPLILHKTFQVYWYNTFYEFHKRTAQASCIFTVISSIFLRHSRTIIPKHAPRNNSFNGGTNTPFHSAQKFVSVMKREAVTWPMFILSLRRFHSSAEMADSLINFRTHSTSFGRQESCHIFQLGSSSVCNCLAKPTDRINVQLSDSLGNYSSQLTDSQKNFVTGTPNWIN